MRKKIDNSKDVITRMNNAFGSMSKGRKQIAAFISDHMEDAVFMTASDLAKATGTSESTVVRFAVELGYKGFPDLKVNLRMVLNNRKNLEAASDDIYSSDPDGDVIRQVLLKDQDNIRMTMADLDTDAFSTAVDIILKAKHVYVVGLRSCEPLADFLHFYLNMIRPDTILIRSTSVSEMFEQMIRIDKDDAIIGISFPRYSMRTLKCMEFANDRNAKVISITDTVHSPMNLYSSCNLLAKSEMTSIVDSLTAPMSVINALIVALCSRKPAKVRSDLKMLENTWENYQVYLSDEINFIGDQPVIDRPLRKKNRK